MPYSSNRQPIGSDFSSTVVVQLLFSCCPVFDWTTTEERHNKN